MIVVHDSGTIGEVVGTIAVQHEVLFIVKVDKRFYPWSINKCQELTEQEYEEWQLKKTSSTTGTQSKKQMSQK